MNETEFELKTRIGRGGVLRRLLKQQTSLLAITLLKSAYSAVDDGLSARSICPAPFDQIRPHG